MPPPSLPASCSKIRFRGPLFGRRPSPVSPMENARSEPMTVRHLPGGRHGDELLSPPETIEPSVTFWGLTAPYTWGSVQLMYTCSAQPVRFLSPSVAACALSLVLAACAGEEPKPAGASIENEAGPPLQDLDLPVSLRSKDHPPTGHFTVEATTEQLRLDSSPVIALSRGKVAGADRANGVIPKLEGALRAGSRSMVALRLAANLPYETVALILNSAKQAGIPNAAFQVRPTGGVKETGWMAFHGFTSSAKSEALPQIPGVEYKSWDAFTQKWEATYEGCKLASSGNCAWVNENVALGGTLRMELMASGRGINVNFFRRGLSPVEEAEEEKKRAQQLARKKEDFLQGRISKDEMVEELLLGHPSTYALFQFRYQEALQGPSALGKTIAPMCSGQKCGLILTADPITPFVRIATMIGAAFPDGTELPSFSFEQPWTRKIPPADLAEFIETQEQL